MPEGALIRVKPGRYKGITVFKSPEIVADGPREEVAIEVQEDWVVWWNAPAGRLKGFSLRKLKDGWPTVGISEGAPVFEENDISGRDFPCVMTHGASAAPLLRANRIHSGEDHGVSVYESARARLEANEISGHADFGVVVDGKDSRVEMRHNLIADNGKAGVWLYSGASGRFERNRFKGNKRGAWRIDPNAGPVERIDNIEE